MRVGKYVFVGRKTDRSEIFRLERQRFGLPRSFSRLTNHNVGAVVAQQLIKRVHDVGVAIQVEAQGAHLQLVKSDVRGAAQVELDRGYGFRCAQLKAIRRAPLGGGDTEWPQNSFISRSEFTCNSINCTQR